MPSKKVLKVPVPGFPEYTVTSEGEIYHKRLERILSLHTSKLGYHYVVLFRSRGSSAKKRVQKSPSRIVAEAFVKGKTKTSNRVLFKDQDRNNLKAANLFWGSHQLACQRGNTGRHEGMRGTKNPNSKLNVRQVTAIRKVYEGGKSSHRKLSLKYGVSTTAIYKILKGQTWKNGDQ